MFRDKTGRVPDQLKTYGPEDRGEFTNQRDQLKAPATGRYGRRLVLHETSNNPGSSDNHSRVRGRQLSRSLRELELQGHDRDDDLTVKLRKPGLP